MFISEAGSSEVFKYGPGTMPRLLEQVIFAILSPLGEQVATFSIAFARFSAGSLQQSRPSVLTSQIPVKSRHRPLYIYSLVTTFWSIQSIAP